MSDFEFSVDSARAQLRDETSSVVAAMVGNLARLVGKMTRNLTVSDVFDYYMIPAIDDVHSYLDVISCSCTPSMCVAGTCCYDVYSNHFGSFTSMPAMVRTRGVSRRSTVHRQPPGAEPSFGGP